MSEAAEAPGPEISIVLPTYNERANVAPMVERLRRALAGLNWEVIFVDDDSSDLTYEAVRALGEADRRVRCLRRVGRRGLSGACVEGILAAQAPFAIVMDADQQHDEAILPEMLARLRGGADVVIGTRYTDEGSAAGLQGHRAGISRGATWLAQKVLGLTVSDPMSGYFGVRCAMLNAIAGDIAADGFKVLVDILSARRGALTIAEVPYTFRSRVHGESKLDMRVALDFFALLLSRFTGNVLPQRFLLFCTVGISGVLVHLFVFAWLAQLGFSFSVAQSVAAFISIGSNFWLNNILTYRGQTLRGLKAVYGLMLFYLISAFGLISNVSVAVSMLGEEYDWWPAAIAGAVMSATWNYAVSAALVWRRR